LAELRGKQENLLDRSASTSRNDGGKSVFTHPPNFAFEAGLVIMKAYRESSRHSPNAVRKLRHTQCAYAPGAMNASRIFRRFSLVILSKIP
jgi:hypothetical protein